MNKSFLGCLMLGLGLFLVMPESQKAVAAPALSNLFDESIYKPIDMNRYCRAAYGSRAKFVAVGDHLYDGRCRRYNRNLNISVQTACRQQYGVNSRAVSVGNHKYDWKCIDWRDAHNMVVPVMIVSANEFRDIDDVNTGIERIAGVLENVHAWYQDLTNSGNQQVFNIARPIIKFSFQNNNQWHEHSCLTTDLGPGVSTECLAYSGSEERFRLYDEARDEVEGIFADVPNGTNIAVINFVFTGLNSQPFWYGAAAQPVAAQDQSVGVAYSAQAPSVAACGPSNNQCGVWAVGHELGHTLSLDDRPCAMVSAPSNCVLSIMETNSPFNSLILLNHELTDVLASPFFTP